MDCKTTQNEEQRRSPQTLVQKCWFFWRLTEIRIYQTCFINLRYVLLKEKNMLLTLQQESKRQRIQMPSPERIRKVSLIHKTSSSTVEMPNYIWVALLLCSWTCKGCLLRLKGRCSDWRQWWKRERRHSGCCRQDRREAGLETGGGTYLDTSTGELGFLLGWGLHYYFWYTGYTSFRFLEMIQVIQQLALWKVWKLKYVNFIFLSGIDLKSTLSHGTWINDTRERSSTHPSLWNLTSGETMAAKYKPTVRSVKSMFSLCLPWSYRLRIEKYIRGRVRRASLEREKQLKLKEKFPQIKAPAL